VSDATFLEQFSQAYRWPTAPAKRRFRFQKCINRGMKVDHRLALTLRGVIDRDLDDLEGLQASDYETYQIFEESDLVFKLIDLENIKTSRVGYVPRRGIMSPAYIRLSPLSGVYSRYYYWFFYGAYINNIFNGMGGGVRQNLTPTDLLEFPIPLPDLETQKAIANFLDRETARIDQLIEKKQRLVGLVDEKRAALITAAVTGQTGPGATAPRHPAEGGGGVMRAVQTDTRLQWFGSVPEHWKVARNKSAFRVVSKAVGGRFAEFDLLSLTLQGVKLRDIESGKGKFPASFETYQEVLPGDIVFCLFDIDETPRTVGLSPHKGMVTGAYTVVRCSDLADPRYVTYFYISIDQRKGLRPFYTGLRKVVRADTFLNATFPLPDLQTQKAISDFLDRETARLDVVKSKTNASVDRLREYRAALITAAVTGQIDVAAWGRSKAAEACLEAAAQKEAAA
jgi:type I restriction enzyme, S subunit